MGPVRQNPIQVCSYVCAVHCVQLLHTILDRIDLIIFSLALQTIAIAPMMSDGKGQSHTIIILDLRLAPSTIVILNQMFNDRHRLEIRTGRFLFLEMNSRKYVTH